MNGYKKAVVSIVLCLFFAAVFMSATPVYADIEKLDTPEITALSCTEEEISISWTAVSGAEEYVIRIYCEDEDGSTPTLLDRTIISAPSTSARIELDEDYRDYLIETQDEMPLGISVYARKYDPDAWSVLDPYIYSPTSESPMSLLGTPIITSGLGMTESKIQISWNKISGADGYQLMLYNASSKKYELLRTLNGKTNTSYEESGLSPNTGRTFKVRAFSNAGGWSFTSKDSGAVSVFTLPSASELSARDKLIKDGYVYNPFTNHYAEQDYGNMYLDTGRYDMYRSQVSDISDFFDEKGNYCIAYPGEDYIYIRKYNNSTLAVNNIVKLKRRYHYTGGVTCDSKGNYYVAWGDDDSKETRDKVTFAISKFDRNGNYIASATWDYDTTNTCRPFRSGNCVMTFTDNVLVCSYARLMYGDGGTQHQSSTAVAVNTDTMQIKSQDAYHYVSHSFNQRILTLSDGRILYADHGDAFTRGLVINRDNDLWESVPIHAYGEYGNNETNMQLGGVEEVSTGYMLIGSSGKSLTSLSGAKQLFIQVINPVDGTSRLPGESRSGTCEGEKVTDTGIIWLTDYTDGSEAVNPLTARIGNDQVFIMWEKEKDYEVQLYCAIVSASGKILQKPVLINAAGMNHNEELKYKDGYIYWTYPTDDTYFNERTGEWAGSYSINTYRLAVHSTENMGKKAPEPAPKPVSGDGFSDITETSVNATSYKAIYWAVDNGIVKGYSDGTFRPEVVCTREQFSIMLWRFAGEPSSDLSAVNKFTDVNDFSNSTSRKAVAWAVQQGIVKGFGDGSFRPSDTITRAQVAVMLWRYAGEPPVITLFSKFSDIGSYSANVQKSIIWLESVKIASGYNDGTFRPDDGCQRQHMAIFLYRFNYNK